MTARTHPRVCVRTQPAHGGAALFHVSGCNGKSDLPKSSPHTHLVRPLFSRRSDASPSLCRCAGLPGTRRASLAPASCVSLSLRSGTQCRWCIGHWPRWPGSFRTGRQCRGRGDKEGICVLSEAPRAPVKQVADARRNKQARQLQAPAGCTCGMGASSRLDSADEGRAVLVRPWRPSHAACYSSTCTRAAAIATLRSGELLRSARDHVQRCRWLDDGI